MTCICIKNEHGNTTFTENKAYEMSTKGVHSDWGNMCCTFKDWDRPKTFDVGTEFEFGMCIFKIISK